MSAKKTRRLIARQLAPAVDEHAGRDSEAHRAIQTLVKTGRRQDYRAFLKTVERLPEAAGHAIADRMAELDDEWKRVERIVTGGQR